MLLRYSHDDESHDGRTRRIEHKSNFVLSSYNQ